MIKRTLLLFSVVLLFVTTVLMIKTFTFTSKQIKNIKSTNEFKFDQNKACQNLSEALQFKTISSPDSSKINVAEFRALHQHFEKTFPKFHLTLIKKVIGEYSLIYKWEGQQVDLKPIFLMAHMDVVPAEAEWQNPPFAGHIAEGYIWGRGTLDDKSSVLGIFEAIEILISEGFRPERTIYFAIGHDEEVGGVKGASEIAKHFHSLEIEFEYILDEGGLVVDGILPGVSAPTALIGIAEKGYLSIVLTAGSPGGHSSAPPKHTAVGRLSSAIHKLEANPLPGEIIGATKIMFEYLGPEMSFLPKMLFANLWLTSGILENQFSKSPFTNAMLRTSTAATVFESGDTENVLPESAKAIINFRIIPGDNIAGVVEHVRSTVNDTLIKITPMSMGIKGGNEPVPVSDVKSSHFTRLQYTVGQIFPDAIVIPWLSIGTTDSRYYAKMCDNIYRFAPIQTTYQDLGGYHGNNERISKESYTKAIKFYIQLFRNSTLEFEQKITQKS